MKKFPALMMLGLALLCVSTARAQEGETKVVDQVVARVNSDFIMRSAYERAQQDLLNELKDQGLKDQELEKKFNELKHIVLDQLVDTQLLVQRAKELSIDVEPQINEQLLRVMRENNLLSLEDLAQKMSEAGIDINEVKRMLRTRFLSEAVRNREVYGEIYRKLTEKEKREYYEKHKERFVIPGEVTLSRIFIATGKDPEQALARAREIVAQARSGAADFTALAQRHSEDKNINIGTLKIPDLATEVREAVAKAPVGTITDPIKTDTGYAIFRLDQRKEPETRPFENEEVERAVSIWLTEEKGAEVFETYIQKLRREAFIEVDPRYQLAASKIKSVQIKRTPYTEEDPKKKKKDKDKEKKDAKAGEKAADNAKP
jgi:peptidyl-prolyl cis-trans isomerase C